jgi:hypothetical protein
MPDHRSLGGQLNGLDELPELPSGQHDWPTVLNACLAELQRNLFATAPQAVLDAIDALERDVTVRLDGLSEAVVDRSVARGQTIAMAIWDWSLTDGFDRWNDCAYTPPTGEGQWVHDRNRVPDIELHDVLLLSDRCPCDRGRLPS